MSFFGIVVSAIERHPVFHSTGCKKQAPVPFQLLVTFKKLGVCGNGASNGIIAGTFSISYGTVSLFYDRCVRTIHSLKAMVILWPDEDERVEISHRIEEKFGFPYCIGFIDGTLFP